MLSSLHNLQGDIVAILDGARAKAVEYEYDAWGNPIGDPWTLTTAYAALAALNPFRYRGYVWDQETGLYYLQSRYNNPQWGRFMNADALLGDNGVLLAHNMFAYCAGNPVNGRDSTGARYERTAGAVAVISPNKVKIIEDKLYYRKKMYKLVNPNASYPRFMTYPSAVGKSFLTKFSGSDFAKEVGTYALDSYGLLNLFKDSLRYIDMTVLLRDDLNEASVTLTFTRNDTEMELESRANNVEIKSDTIPLVYTKDGHYYFEGSNGELMNVVDNRNWLLDMFNNLVF